MAAPGTLGIWATDSGFRAPASIDAGLTRIEFINDGSDIHEVMLVKLPDGMSGADYLERVRDGDAFPEGALDYSGPGLTEPGASVDVWLELDPGRYLLACWYKGHLTEIGPHVLTVDEPGQPEARHPEPDVVVTLVDYAFVVEGRFRSGTQVIRIETVAEDMHEMDIFRLHEGRTMADLQAWQDSGKAGEPPADPVGGVLDNHDLSRVVSLRTTLSPGRYVLWCNMDGPTDDFTHARAGMRHEFTIES